MSINDLGQKKAKIICFGLLAVLICSLIGLFRQGSIYFYTRRKLSEKERELKDLEMKNQALKVRFKEVQKPEFLEEQAKKLLGLSSLKKEVLPEPTLVLEPVALSSEEKIETSNFQKWLGLFFY
ncbi:hypothetical protein COS54_02975 [Candidatus Shapirobacteria bacterium CG03_land_8_20_14_0_80_39_12]|uniref:Cell division protein FtsL n=1 Tax=Candidatus Shapirobacteria bacterium CG03_land_8_20_14_0_80_39_12 TaxID=1974879 RepID=A0A2M7BBJ7_9BACT|nr:MAG: hypothetical protein COS54_02975 [Candidatus Shapirobacteria bacterium CG03_land_8_20_14_0_80_39_12]